MRVRAPTIITSLSERVWGKVKQCPGHVETIRASCEGDTSIGIEEACESMQDDWKRLLLRMRGPAAQQALPSVGCIRVRHNQTNAQNCSSLMTFPEAATACLLLQASNLK